MAIAAKEKKKKVTKKAVKKSPSKKSTHDTSAFEAKMKDGSAVVGMLNLHVVITQDSDLWFAQGLEVDYAAQGISEKDVRKEFEQGLCATIHAHLNEFGSIKNLLKPAPQEVWKEMLYDHLAELKSYSQISSHKAKSIVKKFPVKEAGMFPFEQIQYLEPELACA